MRTLTDIVVEEGPGRPAVQATPDRAVIIAGSGTDLVAASFLAEAFRRIHPGVAIGVYG